MDNHGQRPEIREALAGAVGHSTRYSSTEQEERIYAAVPLMHGGKPTAVVRTSLPVTALTRTLGIVGNRLVVAGLIGSSSPSGHQPGDLPPHQPAAGGDQGRSRSVCRGRPEPSAGRGRFPGSRRRGQGPQPHGRAIGRANPDGIAPAERKGSDALQHGGRSFGHRQPEPDSQFEQDLCHLAGRRAGQAGRAHGVRSDPQAGPAPVRGIGAGQPVARRRRDPDQRPPGSLGERPRHHAARPAARKDRRVDRPARRYPVAPSRRSAPRLRGQRLPRVADPDHVDQRLHRDPFGRRPGGQGERPPLPANHAPPGKPPGRDHRRPALAVAHRTGLGRADDRAGGGLDPRRAASGRRDVRPKGGRKTDQGRD